MKKRRFFALFLVLGLLVSLLSVPASAFEEIDVDARAALLSMGFSPQEAELALDGLDGAQRVEDLLASALKRIGMEA